MTELLFKENHLNYWLCMQIHKSSGIGLKEINYKDAMEIDFIELGIDYNREKKFVVYDSIVIEVKSVSAILDSHLAQALSYLAVSGMNLALVINFGERSLTRKRIVL